MDPKFMNFKVWNLALVSVLFCGVSVAQEAPGGAFSGQVPVSASLKKTLSSKDAKVGQEITATTEKPVAIDGTLLPRNSLLLGHVVDVSRHSKETPNGSLTIVFDHAQTKKGDPVGIRASVYRISLSEGQILGRKRDVDLGMRGSADEANATSAVREGTDRDDHSVQGMQSNPGAAVHVVSAIPGVALSAVASDDKSAILSAQNQDVELDAGTELVVGIAMKQ